MEPKNNLHRHSELLTSISHLPRKMLSLHGRENITEFVLHELCQQHCFNLDKAAYFIDNPDFKCIKGVTGFSKAYCDEKQCDAWQNPSEFSSYMEKNPFNNKVRSVMRSNNLHQNADQVIKNIASELEFNKPIYHLLPMKHDNCGLFMFEAKNSADELDEYMPNVLYLLGFCPIF